MKVRMTMLAALAAGVWCATPMAQNTSNPAGSEVNNAATTAPAMSGTSPAPGTTTNSPNPNKAQNSDMRTQGGSGTSGYATGNSTASDARYRGRQSTIGQTNSPNSGKSQNRTDMQGSAGMQSGYVTEPSASSRGLTNSPNPNKAQNSEMKTQ